MSIEHDPIHHVFQACRHEAGSESSGASPCPEIADLGDAVQRDRQCDYLWLSPEREGASEASRDLRPPPCLLFIHARKALSVGDYHRAETLLQPVSTSRTCGKLLELEKARLHWFREEFDQAAAGLKRLTSGDVPPTIRHRAANIGVASRIEIVTLSRLGCALPGATETIAPRDEDLRRLAEEMDTVARSANDGGDVECGDWARLDSAVALLLSGDRSAGRSVLSLANAVPNNAVPHALRRVGGALAVTGDPRRGAEILLTAHRGALTRYPDNFVAVKSALDLLCVTARSEARSLHDLARTLLQEALRRFVSRQACGLDAPFFVRANQAWRLLLGRDVLTSVRSSPREDLESLLPRVAWRQLESTIALSLLRHLFTRANLLPPGTTYFDLEARHELAGVDARHYGVQVKSGKQTLKQKDIPGSETLRNRGYNGFIAISPAALGPHAARQLELLGASGFAVHDWTGAALVDLLMQYPDVLGSDAQQIARLCAPPRSPKTERRRPTRRRPT